MMDPDREDRYRQMNIYKDRYRQIQTDVLQIGTDQYRQKQIQIGRDRYRQTEIDDRYRQNDRYRLSCYVCAYIYTYTNFDT